MHGLLLAICTDPMSQKHTTLTFQETGITYDNTHTQK